LDAARELLAGVWDLAERGPFPLDHANGLNVLAQVERDAMTLTPRPPLPQGDGEQATPALTPDRAQHAAPLQMDVGEQARRENPHWQAAVIAALAAYRKAWCDGPLYAYHWGLERAKAHLAALGADYPLLPPFDESKFEPMVAVEINPKDEYWVEE